MGTGFFYLLSGNTSRERNKTTTSVQAFHEALFDGPKPRSKGWQEWIRQVGPILTNEDLAEYVMMYC